MADIRSYNDYLKVPGKELERLIHDRQHLLRREIEHYLRHECVDMYPERNEKYWRRDYSSVPAYLKSVQSNRQRWQEALGVFDPMAGTPEVEWEPFLADENMEVRWLKIRFAENYYGRALLGVPRRVKGRLPMVICQHGAGSAPETVFGLHDDANLYHSFGYRLVRDGFIVLAPLCVTTIEEPSRNRCARLSLLLGKTIFGLEISVLKRLLDYVTKIPQVDAGRIGIWGISMGGQYTMFCLPVEERIKVGIICAFFNHRRRKMVIEDVRYSCFLPLQEGESMYIPGLLREFSDSDLLALICPRAVQVQAGKADEVSWWPDLIEEFKEGKEHYQRLGINDHIELDMHEGGHEIRYENGLAFLKKWL